MPKPKGYLLRAVAGIPKKARRCLYGGAQVTIGTRVSKDYEVKSKKLVKPNVVKTKLYSQALQQFLPLRVSTEALRQIDDAGGLDRWLLQTPDAMLHSDIGSDLKFRIGLIYRHQEYEQRKLLLEPRSQQQLLDGAAVQRAAAAAAAVRGRQAPSLLPPAAAALAARDPSQ